MSRAPLPPTPFRPAAGTLALVGVLGVAVLAYCALLWPEWRHNPDLSHGYFAPLIFVLLLGESRRQGPWRWIPPGPWATAGVAALIGVGWLTFALAGLFAATLAWSHAVVLFLLGVALIFLLSGGLLILAGDSARLLPINWISVTALGLWVLAAPLPDGTYARLTLGLQQWVSGSVMNFLQLAGIPARQHGNVIELAHTTVGVEEACSGVRSLISCLYAGLFFAAWQVRGPLRRALLVGFAIGMALGMNLLRSLTLTLLANAGVDIAGTWHDATGYAILGVTAAVLAGLAMLLESPDDQANRPAAAPAAHRTTAKAPQRVFWIGTLATLALAGFFLAHSRSRPTAVGAPPALASLLPPTPAGWESSDSPDLYRFSGILQSSDLLQRNYRWIDAAGQPVQLTVYIAFWQPGQASVSRVASHTPDACWPGSGWTSQTAGGDRRQSLSTGGPAVAPAEYRLFQSREGTIQHVWFWHIFDGRVIAYQDPYSIPALLQIALKYGFQRQGSQYFVRLSSNRPWNELAQDPLPGKILTQLAGIGL